MVYLQTLTQACGLIAAVILLIGSAILLNRVLGGLPYPTWRHDSRLERDYGDLAGISRQHTGYWQRMADDMLMRKSPSPTTVDEDVEEPVSIGS